jgi:hypothetical protein
MIPILSCRRSHPKADIKRDSLDAAPGVDSCERAPTVSLSCEKRADQIGEASLGLDHG